MADRSVKVRLWADTTAYEASMRKASASTADLAQSSGRNLQKLGGQMTDVGKKATMGITVPLAGVGVAAVKLSNDFNSTFSQMVGLAGVAAEDVDGLKDSVLDLAGETARAPQELAEALYFAASAGLTTEQAMDAVTIAAQAAASGLGTTQDIVGLAASAVASYGEENINAAEATDILVSTIREGRAEPAELAGTLGRVLPIAAQLGVTFDEVGGTVAVLSNVFGDTNRTVTATQGMLVKLLSPTQQGRDALAEMGTSVEELHAAIDQDGLLGALELLRSKGFDTNATALRALFDDIEGFQAASALLAADQETLTDTFGATADSAGSLAQAYGALDEDSQSLKQAWVDLQVALIQVGDILGPIVADIAAGVGSLAKSFGELPSGAQKGILAFGALAAAAGPALMVAGSLVRNYQQITTTWSNMGRGSRLAVGALGGVGLALSAAVMIYESYNRKKREAKQRTDEFVAALEAEAAGQKDAVNAELARKLAELADEFERLGISATDAARYIKGENVPAVEALIAASDKYGVSAEGFKIMQDQIGLGAEGNAADFKKVTDTIKDNESAYQSAREVYNATVATMDELSATTDTNSAAQSELQRLLDLSTSSADDTAESIEELTEATEEDQAAQEALQAQLDRTARYLENQKNKADRAREAHERFVESILNSLGGLFSHEQQVLRTENAYADYTVAVLENAGVQKDAEATDRDKERSARDLRSAEIDLAEQAYATADAYATEQGAVEGSKGWADKMIDSLSTQAAQYPELRDEIAEYIARLEVLRAQPDIMHRIGITYSTHYAPGYRAGPQSSFGSGGKRALGGPTLAGSSYEVLEGGKSELLTEGGKTYLMAARDGMVTPLSGVGNSFADKSDPPNVDVRVFLGDREIRDTIRVEIDTHDRERLGALRQGRRG